MCELIKTIILNYDNLIWFQQIWPLWSDAILDGDIKTSVPMYKQQW